jgi:16S rRNA processing protein RimM
VSSSIVAVGFVHRPHGLNGEVSVERVGDSEDLFHPGEFVWICGERRRELRLSSSRAHGERWLLSFEGITDVDAARELAGGVLCLPADRLSPEDADFYWSHELEGWICEDTAGHKLGEIRQLEETAAGPQLTLETPEGHEVLIPFVRPILVEVDRQSHKIILDPPEGLMEL